MMQAGVTVEHLTVSVGGFQLNHIDFKVARDEILVVLGPNGSGKSVTLETIAGFHRPSQGRVFVGTRDVTQLAPERRNVAFLVQNFGLFPHLSVEQNVAIALRHNSGDKQAALPFGNVAALLAHFSIAHLGRHTPQSLSPGEKQRVALARALAAQPDLFLFDEPFSALDSTTREQLRVELLSFLRDLAIPAIFVTHDHADAMMLADKVVVLRNGAIVQAGPPADIFNRPANSVVASFVGVENVLDGVCNDNAGAEPTVIIGGRRLYVSGPIDLTLHAVKVSIRAEAVQILGADAEDTAGQNRLAARVTAVRAVGPLATIALDCGFPLKAYVLAPQVRAMKLVPGRKLDVSIAAAAIHLMPG